LVELRYFGGLSVVEILVGAQGLAGNDHEGLANGAGMADKQTQPEL
jgi:hypothetical protein